PAELGQEEAGIGLIELDLFWVRIAEAVALAFLLQAWKVRPLGEEVGMGPIQILELLLQRMDRSVRKPERLGAVAPLGEQLAQVGVAEFFVAILVRRLWQGQRLVEHEPACPGNTAHIALLFSIGINLYLKA
ncbi:MAG: hypothetical protein FWF31_04265, partial [Desulfobulbus sp.]|nr:hypothetical protein [Desulfobulbus sp.]